MNTFKILKFRLQKQADGSYMTEFRRGIDWSAVVIVLFFIFLIAASSYNVVQ